MSRSPLLHILLVLVATLSFHIAQAQLEETFVPLRAYNETDVQLIQGLRNQLQNETNHLGPKRTLPIMNVYTRTTNNLVKGVKKGLFVKDSVLQEFVNTVFHDLMQHTSLRRSPVRVLIARMTNTNAMCMGEGTFLVTTGLLANIDNESQLAFTLAHEIAHYELDHVKQRIVQQVETKYVKKTTKSTIKILSTDDPSASEIDSLRKMVYSMNRFNREHEREADSLGVIISRNAGYNVGESIALLSILDSARFTKHPLGNRLFDAFQFPKYPFQERWLRLKQVGDKEEKPGTFFIYSRDSLRSHPDIELRQKWLTPSVAHEDARPVNKHDPQLINDAIARGEFEYLHTVFLVGSYDCALTMALQLKARYNSNSYLVTIISKIFLAVFPQDPVTLSGPRSRYPYFPYDDVEELFVNAFLHNLDREEAYEVAFNFLNNQDNFNRDFPEHYYLLWKICGLTDRTTVQARVLENFKATFSKEKYRQYFSSMK